MKKIYLLILTIASSVALCSAQSMSAPQWGVRAGVNFSNLSSPDYSTNYLTGYTLGVAYLYPVSQSIPIYVESGLYFQKQGARDNGFLTESGEDSKFSKYEFEIPVLVGYNIPISQGWDMQAFVGLYYSVAVNGKFKIGDEEFDPFKDEMLQTLRDTEPTEQQLLHRSDFGARFGVSVTYNRYLFGFAYDAGLLNQYSSELRDAGYQALSGCFTLQLGYNF